MGDVEAGSDCLDEIICIRRTESLDDDWGAVAPDGAFDTEGLFDSEGPECTDCTETLDDDFDVGICSLSGVS